MSLWRYRDHLPVDPHVTLGEGNTPLVHASWISKKVKAEVWLKVEGANPTGSFKDRGMTVAVSQAISEGAHTIVCASTGNTAASAAAYAARAGLRCLVVIPEGKVAAGKLMQAQMYGATVVMIAGNFDVAFGLVKALCDARPITLVNSVNPYRLQGQKTAAFEVLDQFVPDNLAIPVGNAGNISAWWQGFSERGASPSMFGFQAEGSAPLVDGHIIEFPNTVATAIRIGNPSRGAQALAIAKESGGSIRSVTDEEILEAQRLIAKHEGVFAEPASAASVAGILRYGARGVTVCVLTGNGLKDPQVDPHSRLYRVDDLTGLQALLDTPEQT